MFRHPAKHISKTKSKSHYLSASFIVFRFILRENTILTGNDNIVYIIFRSELINKNLSKFDLFQNIIHLKFIIISIFIYISSVFADNFSHFVHFVINVNNVVYYFKIIKYNMNSSCESLFLSQRILTKVCSVNVKYIYW